MSTSHFNFQTMEGYHQKRITKEYNPFDYPEEWEFFTCPLKTDEGDDVLTDLYIQIRKMTRRIHLFFDNPESHRMETPFYFGLLDSLTEVEDYLLGAMNYARYCRLEKLFLLTAGKDLETFVKELSTLKEELFSKISTFGEHVVELNQECHKNDLFIHDYCDLTQNGVPNDMLRAMLRVPDFPHNTNAPLTIDEKTSVLSYLENVWGRFTLTEEEQNIEGARDSSGLDELLQPVDMLLWNIRGTLLWVVLNKITNLYMNAKALLNRHNECMDMMRQNAYEEICDAYARSKAYIQKRDEEFPQQCAQDLYMQDCKPTDEEVHKYFKTHYSSLMQTHNKSYQLYFLYRKQEDTFRIEFLRLLLDEDTREDAQDYLFFRAFSKELCKMQTSSGNHSAHISKLDVDTLSVKRLNIEGGTHTRFPECLNIDDSIKLYEFLSQNGFINREKTPLADFNYLMGAATQYTTPDGPKPICWLLNVQMLRQMLLLAFAPLLKDGTKQARLGEIVPHCFVDVKNKPLNLPKEDSRAIDYAKMKALEIFFTTILRPETQS